MLSAKPSRGSDSKRESAGSTDKVQQPIRKVITMCDYFTRRLGAGCEQATHPLLSRMSLNRLKSTAWSI